MLAVCVNKHLPTHLPYCFYLPEAKQRFRLSLFKFILILISAFSHHGNRVWSPSQHASGKSQGTTQICRQSIVEQYVCCLCMYYRVSAKYILKQYTNQISNMRSSSGSIADLHFNTSEFLTVMIRMTFIQEPSERARTSPVSNDKMFLGPIPNYWSP